MKIIMEGDVDWKEKPVEVEFSNDELENFNYVDMRIKLEDEKPTKPLSLAKKWQLCWRLWRNKLVLRNRNVDVMLNINDLTAIIKAFRQQRKDYK